MKKAIECFKYLLVNGFDDPYNIMKDLNRNNNIIIIIFIIYITVLK